MAHLSAPWTPEQVEALNRWQRCNYVHEFTCPHPHGPLTHGRILIATKNGWTCPTCDYTQNWAHSWMMFEPPNPFG